MHNKVEMCNKVLIVLLDKHTTLKMKKPSNSTRHAIMRILVNRSEIKENKKDKSWEDVSNIEKW